MALVAGLLAAPSSAHARGHDRDGSLDRTFGTGGKVTTDFLGAGDTADALIVQPDGKLVAAGSSGSDFGLARYHRNGSLDRTFGAGGKVATDLGFDDVAHALIRQPDGKLVAAGYTAASPEELPDFALARYHRDGSLDFSFGVGGLVRTDLGGDDIAYALIRQPDGRLVAAGQSTRGSGPELSTIFALTRYLPDGSLDTSFGTGGGVFTSPTGDDRAHALVVQTDGKLVAGGVSAISSNSNFALARYHRDGSLDTRFGNDGMVVTDFGGGDNAADAAYALVLQNGKLVAGGYATTATSTGADLDFALARYMSDGTLDTSFGVAGRTTTTFHPGGVNINQINALAVSRGRIVAAGSVITGPIDGLIFDVGLTRYRHDGTLDTHFGTGGRVTTDFAGDRDQANALTVQPDGRLVVAGHAQTGDTPDFALARYRND
ncbi:delta-60 repeat domain-containing protein [Paractinoplanes rishiriensis]|uniref:delta-60 repeat domain-containing protein n=1 Tax=Paractinoplanes rishiriensis TaxID=1050105 RepID=UPI001942500B|nr:delta-60 repeat domain-containing protein [Actinoplanes rishiriensis]